ncbi:MAG: hypothetical protein HY914_11880 [Desulfomonile tiedjei]|nr:hypothetical protein [Desulfomonile tiedjei]
MKKIYGPVIGVISMALAAGLLCLPCSAQEINVSQLPSDACQQLQSKINEMLAISDSTSLTDAAKVAELRKAWAETWKSMQETGKDDSEINDMVKEFSQTLNRLIAMAVASASSGNQEVSEDAKRALVDLKKQIKPYMSFMKMLCPRLVVPEVLTK